MARTEVTSSNEDSLKARRRLMIEEGHNVSLVALDPERDLYVFDYECCDGTGWTGNPFERCTTHYEPSDPVFSPRVMGDFSA